MNVLLDRFNTGNTGATAEPDPNSLRVVGDSLYRGQRLIAEFTNRGAALAGLEVERRRDAIRRAS